MDRFEIDTESREIICTACTNYSEFFQAFPIRVIYRSKRKSGWKEMGDGDGDLDVEGVGVGNASQTTSYDPVNIQYSAFDEARRATVILRSHVTNR
jgi:hypothetical protein